MMMLSQAANVLNGELLGDDALFTAVSKDTRTITQGDLYVALKGERFDGHAFVAEAGNSGAVGALVSERLPLTLPQVRVADTRLALGELAASWRRAFDGKLIGITGSNGKTTVKEMCRSILAACAGDEHVLSTQGNLNNDIGMPMTLLSVRRKHRYAVIEMGANHTGEIEYLAGIAQPDVAVITNAGPAHLEGFGSVEQVARAKAEIYGGLGEHGIAVINIDDEYASYWLEVCKNTITRTFSMQRPSADVYAEAGERGDWVLHAAAGSMPFRLPVPGRHNVMNALAAATVSLALDIELEHIQSGLENFAGVPGRLAIRHAANGACIIDDSYNANPQSLKAAVEVLVSMPGHAWLVLGDMAELGEGADSIHAEAGRQARQMGVERLFATGSASRHAVDGFGEGATYYDNREQLVASIEKEMDNNVVILVKGSRASAMDRVVDTLIDKERAGNNKNNNEPGVN